MNNEKKKLIETAAPSVTTEPQTGAPPQVGAYVPSDNVKAAQAAIAAQKKPEPYTSKWQGQINDTLSKILNREEFSYDVNADKLFEQYKGQAVRNGKLAMEDTIGKMSTMTGGYGNSWAQTAGQAAFAGEMEKLNDIIPELEALAYERFKDKREELKEGYGLLLDADAEDYGRHRDEVSDFRTERDYLTGLYENERAFDYGVHRDTVDDARYDTEWQYQKDRDVVEDGRYETEWDYQKDRDGENTAYEHAVKAALVKAEYGDFSGLAEVYGVDEKNAKALWAESRYAGMYSGSGSRGTGGDDDIPGGDPEYLPYGNMGENDFYNDLAGYYSDYMENGGKGAGLQMAIALVKRAGATEEAKKALGDYFGEAVVKEAFPEAVPENVTSGKSKLLTKSQYMRTGGKESGVPYEDYVYDTVSDMIEKGEISYDEGIEIISRSER